MRNMLNPKIWDHNKLKSDVKDKILEIVDEFINFIEVPLVPVDIYIVGSNASFNYNHNSDLDIHIISNFSVYESSEELVQILMNLERSKFNEEYDIKIKGIDAEIYVEDINSSSVSNGIYSVYRNMWIKFPEVLKDLHNNEEVKELFNELMKKINVAILTNNVEELDNILNELYLMRKESLMLDGELGTGNLAFKMLRNEGIIDDIRNKLLDLKSNKLSLESVIRKILKEN